MNTFYIITSCLLMFVMFLIVVMILRLPVPANSKENKIESLKYFIAQCENFGSVPSCETLGAVYSVGMEGQMRLCETFPNSDTYCEKDSLFANTRRNKKLAVKYYNLACLEGNSPDSCFFLYLWFKGGDGVPKSSKKAKKYLNKACEGFTFTACI